MAVRLISITTMIPVRTGFAWWSCEVDVPDDVAKDDASAMTYIEGRLVRDGVLMVTRLHLMDTSDRDRKYVTKRRPHLLGKHLIGSITPMRPIVLLDMPAEAAA